MSIDIINYDKIYHSKLDGDYIILEEVNKNKFGHRQVKIKWLDTNNEQIVELQMAKRSIVRDKKKHSIDYSKIYQSNNFGPFKIIKEIQNLKGNHKLVEIKFIETGTIKNVRLADALIGNIKDEYRANVYGIGCIGNASSYHPFYQTWLHMLSRCYNINDRLYPIYGGSGVTVCDRWLCFENFIVDLPFIDGYEECVNSPNIYQLDKDYKQYGMPKHLKVYSLETCCFMPVSENARIAQFENNANKYIGVTNLKSSFSAHIVINNEKVYLGNFDTEELAAIAYNNALKYYYKNSYIKNNVPDIQPENLIKMNNNPKVMCKII